MKRSEITEEDNERFRSMIGMRVRKSRPDDKSQPKPFKSGLKVNTVSGIGVHPKLGCLVFLFVEDDSFVCCHICHEAPKDVL
jgi:hypothetical protein